MHKIIVKAKKESRPQQGKNIINVWIHKNILMFAAGQRKQMKMHENIKISASSQVGPIMEMKSTKIF